MMKLALSILTLLIVRSRGSSLLSNKGFVEFPIDDDDGDCIGVKCLTKTTYKYCEGTKEYLDMGSIEMSCSPGLVCTGELKSSCGYEKKNRSSTTIDTSTEKSKDDDPPECSGIKCLSKTTYIYCRGSNGKSNRNRGEISCPPGLVCTGDIKRQCAADNSTVKKRFKDKPSLLKKNYCSAKKQKS